MNRQITEDFGGSENTVYGTVMWIRVIHLSKFIECTPPRVNPKVNHGTWGDDDVSVTDMPR